MTNVPSTSQLGLALDGRALEGRSAGPGAAAGDDAAPLGVAQRLAALQRRGAAVAGAGPCACGRDDRVLPYPAGSRWWKVAAATAGRMPPELTVINWGWAGAGSAAAGPWRRRPGLASSPDLFVVHGCRRGQGRESALTTWRATPGKRRWRTRSWQSVRPAPATPSSGAPAAC